MFTETSEEFTPHYLAEIRQESCQTTATKRDKFLAQLSGPLLLMGDKRVATPVLPLKDVACLLIVQINSRASVEPE